MKLEICVGDVTGLDVAIAGGADRIELCAGLPLGGLSPAPSLIAAAAAAPIPVHMLVRPREGGFRYTAREAAMLAADIDAAAQAGLAGVAIGAKRDDGLDLALLKDLLQHAKGLGIARRRPLSITLHRVFDLCDDLPKALEDAVALGFDRLLTSGGEALAIDGAAMLARLHRQAGNRIVILAGSGINASTVTPILEIGIREIHASCGAVGAHGATDDDIRERRVGVVRSDHRHTDRACIEALRAQVDRFAAADA